MLSSFVIGKMKTWKGFSLWIWIQSRQGDVIGSRYPLLCLPYKISYGTRWLIILFVYMFFCNWLDELGGISAGNMFDKSIHGIITVVTFFSPTFRLVLRFSFPILVMKCPCSCLPPEHGNQCQCNIRFDDCMHWHFPSLSIY